MINLVVCRNGDHCGFPLIDQFIWKNNIKLHEKKLIFIFKLFHTILEYLLCYY